MGISQKGLGLSVASFSNHACRKSPTRIRTFGAAPGLAAAASAMVPGGVSLARGCGGALYGDADLERLAGPKRSDLESMGWGDAAQSAHLGTSTGGRRACTDAAAL